MAAKKHWRLGDHPGYCIDCEAIHPLAPPGTKLPIREAEPPYKEFKRKDRKKPKKSVRRRLTPADVREVRRLYTDGSSTTVLGERYGISRTMIWRIVKGVAYMDVD